MLTTNNNDDLDFFRGVVYAIVISALIIAIICAIARLI